MYVSPCSDWLTETSINRSCTHLSSALENWFLDSLEKSASQTSDYLQYILDSRSLRGSRVEIAPRDLDSHARQPSISVPLVSPPHWSISRAVSYFTVEAQSCCNRRRTRIIAPLPFCGLPNFGTPASIYFLQTALLLSPIQK